MSSTRPRTGREEIRKTPQPAREENYARAQLTVKPREQKGLSPVSYKLPDSRGDAPAHVGNTNWQSVPRVRIHCPPPRSPCLSVFSARMAKKRAPAAYFASMW